MKLLIMSDLHGSAYYARVLQQAYKLHQPDKLLLLGDLLYHGPRNDLPREYNPKEVIPILNNLKEHIIAVRGNCDAEVDQMVLEFPILADYEVIPMGHYKIIASHGHIYYPDYLPQINDHDIFMYGHIHIPIMEEKDHTFIINPGSISIPKQDSAHSYGVLENKVFTLYDENHTIIKEFNMNK